MALKAQYTEEQDAELVVLWKALGAIGAARKLGLAHKTVKARLNDMGYETNFRLEWPVERENLLRGHFARGLTAGQSAIILKVSRNAVIGKRLRLGLKSADNRPSRPLPKAHKAPVFVEAKYEAPPVLSPFARPWTEREARQCAYPVSGQGADTVSCCNPSDGRSYCAGHYRICYRPDTASATKRRQREAARFAANADKAAKRTYEDGLRELGQAA